MTADTFASSTRFAPLAMTRTGAPDAARNTSDLAICATEQRSTEAASADVLAGTSYSTIDAATPAAFKASWTRCAEVDKSFAMVTAYFAPASVSQYSIGSPRMVRQSTHAR